MKLLVGNKLKGSSMVMRTCFAVLILVQLVQCSVNDLDSAVALPSLTQAILERKNERRYRDWIESKRIKMLNMKLKVVGNEKTMWSSAMFLRLPDGHKVELES
ncbi:hypothetical protein M3Y95_00461700 [Aphelenchoides besseyi]|nr:hypothetical protein M3Y95_00461700 [Aphelenchoides besseyi]